MRFLNYIMTGIMKPKKEMIVFYEKRTRYHIKRVVNNCNVLSENIKWLTPLIYRADVHDRSKFGIVEYIPYVWMTWYYKERDNGFKYPTKDIENSVKIAIEHHYKNNRHHPEYFDDVSDMTKIDLAEMVCDITAMSQEFNDNPIAFFNNNHLKKFKFTDSQLTDIYNFFDVLGQQNENAKIFNK